MYIQVMMEHEQSINQEGRINRQIDRWIDIDIDRQADIQIDGQRETDKQIDGYLFIDR